jgi:multidrug efflux pump
MISKFFIDRPVFAWVIAITIMLGGALAILGLPIEQYPRIAPPSVVINTSYPGASAKTLEDTVTQVIEQKMSGIDHFRYMSATSDSTGNVSITLTFDPEANPDIAQVQVQNKLQLATPLLPQEVQQQGITVAKAAKSFLMVVGFVSTDGSMTQGDIEDYVGSNIIDPISRVTGVGDTTLFGRQHAMRVWLDPGRMHGFGITTADVVAAIKAENATISAGQLGGSPAVEGQPLNVTVIAQQRLETAAEFGDILLRVNTDGSRLLLKDVARLELGSENYETFSRFNGMPAGGMAIKLSSGANALDTAVAVRAKLAELQKFFPAGLEVRYPYDTTPFVKISIEEVVKTLVEAIVLVVAVMYLFLQNFRATIIPTIAVPVVLLGTFGVMAAMGFTINTLTMFGLVLAIGLLVDDAIVVVENVERVMTDEGLPPRAATRKSMDQVSGALIGIALVLSAVFVPMAFMSGSTGAIYRQFSLTMVSAMVLSVVVALVLTPALCASILKPGGEKRERASGGFFGRFNRAFDLGRRRYKVGVHASVRRIVPFFAGYGLIVAVLAGLFVRMPTAFLPDEDQGILFAQVTLPPGTPRERTLAVVKEVEDYFLGAEKENVRGMMAVVGFNFAGRGQNSGMAFIDLKDWSERTRPEQKSGRISARAMQHFAAQREARVFAFQPPAVTELGNASGFDFQLIDRAGVGHDKLLAARNMMLGMAMQNPALVAVRPNGLEDTPQYKITLDRQKAKALGLSISDINGTLSAAWGSSYVNDFNDKGRVKKVFVQADAPFRMVPDDLNRWYVRGASGAMAPFSSFATAKWTTGAAQLERYNGLPSMEILGNAAPGKSSGDAMRAMEEMADKLPAGIGFEWTGLSYEERLAGSQAPALYAISLIVVFLCLAALYESWTVPLSVMLVVPLGIVGAVLAASLRGLSNDVYFQVGLLTTVGLSAKNAILIVEFAKELRESGRPLIGAVIEAAQQRLRPIIMTSLAFVLGVLPLALANGAGSGSQNAIGTGVMGGMITATVLAVFFVPVFYVAVSTWFGHAPRRATIVADGKTKRSEYE